MTDERTESGSRPASEELDARQTSILSAVIHEHVLTGEPVGSQRVARVARLNLSSASVRGIMADLEDRGLLLQPHTSAGRIPTDRAYRIYVNRMLGRPRPMADTDAQAIDEALSSSRGEIPELLGEASRQLSAFSNQVGLVLAPELGRIIIERLEFVQLSQRRIMAILVGRSGVVHNRVLDIDEALSQPELEHIGRYLTDNFAGRTLPRMRELLKRRISEERAAYDKLVASSLKLGRQATAVEAGEGEVFVDGASNLCESPEFADLAVIRSLLKTLEEKERLIGLLSQLLDGEGVRVMIGDENPLSDLARCSVVASSYGAEGQVMGSVGIVGPTRMQYSKVIPLVDYLARVISRFLSEPGH
jgi:heat-inducible transcriptional repressor